MKLIKRLSLIALLCAAQPALSQSTFWRKLTPVPAAGGNTAIAADPAGTNVFAGTYDQGLYRSVDGGTTWHHALPLANVGPVYSVYHAGNGRVLAGGTGKVYLSDDNGLSWDTVLVASSHPVREILTGRNGALFLCTADYANGIEYGDGVFRSVDGGHSWTAASSGLSYNRSIWHLAVNPSGRLYATMLDSHSSGQGGLYYSDNNGDTWHHLPLRFDGKNVVGNDISATESLDIGISPEDSIYYSVVGSDGAAAVTGIFKNTHSAALQQGLWSISGMRPVAQFWLAAPSEGFYFAGNGVVLGTKTGGPATGGPFLTRNFGGGWDHKTSGVDMIAAGYNRNAFARGQGNRVLMIQDGDEDLYYTDSLVHTPAGIRDLKPRQVRLYPNPSRERFSLQAEGGAPVIERVALYDLSGRLLPSGWKRNGQELEVTYRLETGMYQVTVYYEDGSRAATTFQVAR